MNLEKTFLKTFLKNFEEEAFAVDFWDGEEVILGKGEPLFRVHIKKPLNKKDLLNSTSLAFGEAYMNGDVEFEGDLFLALNTVLKYMDKFNSDHKALPEIFHKITNKSKQKEEVSSHYDIGNDFYSLWLDETMSYS
ncbi:class I SAM-dependent methyltransferase, partial [Clostridium saudiense]|nr:class I SAM-dependent methyltransferase [Clostridium saudiense]